jgi:uncharacterized membrane protein
MDFIPLLLFVMLLPVGVALLAWLANRRRTIEAGDLPERVARLEWEVRRLRQAFTQVMQERAERPAAEEPAVLEALPAEPPSAAVQPTPAPRLSPGARPILPQPETDAERLEEWLGQRGLAWAAVVLLLFATAFFLKYAFDNGWIGPLGRVALGVLAGLGLCGAGRHYHRKGWSVVTQMFTAAGILLLYLTTYASFGYYQLLPRDAGGAFLIVLMAESVALAVLYESPAIANLATVGGLLIPILLQTGEDRYRALFPYLAALDATALGLLLFRPWPVLGTVALVGTQAIYAGWFIQHYHPAKLGPALLFQVVVFGLFLGYSALLALWRQRRAGVEDLARLVLNAVLFASAGYVLLDEDWHAWIGSLALVLAIVYTLLATLVLRARAADPVHALVAVAVALGFLAAVFPLEAHGAWIPLGWAVQGALLAWFGMRGRVLALRGMGLVLLTLAVLRLVFVDTPWGHRQPFVPILNNYALPALLVGASVLAVALAARRFQDALAPDEFTALRGVGLLGILLVWLILSVEAYTWFTAQLSAPVPPPGPGATVARDACWYERAEHLRRSAQVALSVVWAVYAVVVMGLGLRLRSQALRLTALGLFALTILKVFVVDLGSLPSLYRVTAFFVLALATGAAAWGYQKVLAAQKPA